MTSQTLLDDMNDTQLAIEELIEEIGNLTETRNSIEDQIERHGDGGGDWLQRAQGKLRGVKQKIFNKHRKLDELRKHKKQLLNLSQQEAGVRKAQVRGRNVDQVAADMKAAHEKKKRRVQRGADRTDFKLRQLRQFVIDNHPHLAADVQRVLEESEAAFDERHPSTD